MARETRKFRLWVSLSLVGCRKEWTIDVEAEDVPDDPDGDSDFNEYMLEEFWNAGVVDWGFEEVEK